MKYFQISQRIDRELAESFFKFCNENAEDDWTITIWTIGGQRFFSSAITLAINQHKKQVVLVGLSIYSAGFEIFYNSSCAKIITTHSLGMWHLASADMRMNSNGKQSYLEDEAIVKNWKEEGDKNFIGVMNKKELKQYKEGEEVYFTFKRLKQIFPDAELIP